MCSQGESSDVCGDDLTRWLARLVAGAQASAADPDQSRAIDRILPMVYAELRAMAAKALQGERGDHTLQATALAHEAYLRLIGQRKAAWQSRAHFFAIASQMIRRILVDHARGKQRGKRGGGRQKVLLTDADPSVQPPTINVVALDEALTRLAIEEPLEARIVEMRYFAGMNVEEIAGVLNVTPRTVQRRWKFAKAWLQREISKGDSRP